ncbi:MAG: BREX system P-loop protein BrxC [Campylobacterota bacterium]|nr:BREX system P-loop protein BrxC [Campylobacterota bacterium]
MTKINEILTLDLHEDIKNVIDLEDRSETETQYEIESYIITDGISEHLSDFINEYTSNIKETGVWISGFYGSGKSYFGKMLGYLIDNPSINGTHARDRFIARIKGIKNESFIESDIRSLDAINSRVVFLDVAKQNTDNGLAFTLFTNFLKNLGFREDLYGYMEFELYISGELNTFEGYAQELFNKEWSELKKSNKEVARAMRQVYAKMGYSDDEYNDTKKVYDNAIESFDANKLKEEIEKYLAKFKDETIVFIFDEASEAISQNKFNLLDLEGISESLSSLSGKVWTIAIAQEKLDDVINNANVNKSQLTKVTDRFKTKIHLDATDVDIIIRGRLLQKKDEHIKTLMDFYNKNNGEISEATNLTSSFPTKTESAEEFATYYPFHKYQFHLLQKFLFSSNALVATQIAARGMIITTFDVLRKQMRDESLFAFTTGHDICSEAQTAPPTDLGIKYDNAKKVLKHANSKLEGELLLKTIHFLSDSELVPPTVENITKSYIKDLQIYYSDKPLVEEALALLVEAKILLLSNNNYKITSDLESKMLEEMKDFDVELYIKKRELTTYIKKTGLFNSVASINDNDLAYKFNILTDLDDDISPSTNKHLRLTAYSLFNINGNIQDFIEGIRMDTQYDKDLITLIPNNSHFEEISKLIEEVRRYEFMEDKYSNDNDQNKRQIIREFSIIKEEKEKDLLSRIQEAYVTGSLIYLYDVELLNRDSFKGTTNEVQRKLINNNYTKRLTSQLSESIAPKLLNEQTNSKLQRNFSGDAFKFFDDNGNFIGENLKVVEEIKSRIVKLTDGKSIEMELLGAPWGYAYGTVVTTLAALFRAGRLLVKHQSHEYFAYSDKNVHEVFTTSNRFKAASFKSLSKTLSTSQKNEIVGVMTDLKFYEHTGKKISWDTNDFELVDAIRVMAEHFIGSLTTMKDMMSDFESVFANVANQKAILQNYSSLTTEANYIDKAEEFLYSKSQFIDAINAIVKAQKFIKKNFLKVKDYKSFASEVVNELSKADKTNDTISEAQQEFNNQYKTDLVANFGKLQDLAQNIKDEYFQLMKSDVAIMTRSYEALQAKITKAQQELKSYPAELNTLNAKKLQELSRYCSSRIVSTVEMEYSIECKNCSYSLSEVLNYIQLVANKESELTIIESSFVKVAPPPPPPEGTPAQPKAPKSIKLKVPNKVMSVQEYRTLLSAQLQSLAGLSSDEQIELSIDKQ